MVRASTSSVLALAIACAACAGAVLVPGDARACGGVFIAEPRIDQPASRSIVRDHRMAIAIGRTRTVIWDEVRLEGDPRDFAWITPVKPGTTIELADDEWLSALDVSTQPVVYGPREGSYGGCALTGCAADEDNAATTVPGGSVFIVKEEVLGPYDSVTVRSAGDPDAPYRWLQANGYRIDDEKVRGVLAQYASAGFDFAALKLRATCHQTAMQPVRIVVPGPDPRILVRMALAGARLDVVPITLFVLAEAPYRPSTYPFGFIDDDLLEWDRPTSRASTAYYATRSNYDVLANDVMAREGKTWLVESAQLAELAGGTSRRLPTPGLFEAYEALCSGNNPRNADTRSGSDPTSTSTSNPGVKAPCNTADAGVGVRDASADGSTDASDASTDAAPNDAGDDANDGGEDAGEDDAGIVEEDSGIPTGFDSGVVAPRCLQGSDSDYQLATRDVVGASQIWVTRLRARIQPNALVNDLDLVPATGADARAISNLHQVARYDDEDERPSKTSCRTSGPRRVVRHDKRAPGGTWALGAAAALVLTAWLRRKK